jgi:hypothetical protein
MTWRLAGTFSHPAGFFTKAALVNSSSLIEREQTGQRRPRAPIGAAASPLPCRISASATPSPCRPQRASKNHFVGQAFEPDVRLESLTYLLSYFIRSDGYSRPLPTVHLSFIRIVRVPDAALPSCHTSTPMIYRDNGHLAVKRGKSGS